MQTIFCKTQTFFFFWKQCVWGIWKVVIKFQKMQTKISESVQSKSCQWSKCKLNFRVQTWILKSGVFEDQVITDNFWKMQSRSAKNFLSECRPGFSEKMQIKVLKIRKMQTRSEKVQSKFRKVQTSSEKVQSMCYFSTCIRKCRPGLMQTKFYENADQISESADQIWKVQTRFYVSIRKCRPGLRKCRPSLGKCRAGLELRQDFWEYKPSLMLVIESYRKCKPDYISYRKCRSDKMQTHSGKVQTRSEKKQTKSEKIQTKVCKQTMQIWKSAEQVLY